MEKHSLKNILNFNSKCYSFKYIKYNDGLFNKTVSATYVIHLKGNGRYENIISQLNEYCPTSDVYILMNNGYKKCNKTKNIVYPADDLIDAFFQIFKHYLRIMILQHRVSLDQKEHQKPLKKGAIHKLQNDDEACH